MVSDNATGFTSEEFKDFLKRNGVQHLFSAPYHPASNGQAEITVRKVKESLRCMQEGGMETRLRRVLFKDHITPSTTTGYSPAELMFGRRLRSALTLVRPDLGQQVRRSHATDTRKVWVFKPGDPVLTKNFGKGDSWLTGVVYEVLGATNYWVLLEDGRKVHRHVDQLRRYNRSDDPGMGNDDWVEQGPGTVPEVPEMDRVDRPGDLTRTTPAISEPEEVVADEVPLAEQVSSDVHFPVSSPTLTPSAEPRRSTRKKQPPVRLQDYV